MLRLLAVIFGIISVAPALFAAQVDPFTRISWLRRLAAQNGHAFQRCIYIPGTPQEKTLGQPASYGCIRMKSSDITALYNQLLLGSIVQIVSDRLPKVPKAKPLPPSNTLVAELEKTTVQDQPGSKSDSASLTVEQMRMAGALAAERQKREARQRDKAAPALNNDATVAQNKTPRA